MICKKCGTETTNKNVSKGYFTYCPICDEDKYSFEVDQRALSVDEITEIFFDMLAEDKPFEDIQKATGILKVVEDESQTVITIYYPKGEIISHWV